MVLAWAEPLVGARRGREVGEEVRQWRRQGKCLSPGLAGHRQFLDVAVRRHDVHVARVQRLGDILDIIGQKLFRLILAGWHIWPIVGLISFVWIPVRWRVLVGGCIGFGWNIFLSIVAVSTTPVSAVAKPGG